MTHAGQPGALARPSAAGYKQGGFGAPDVPARWSVGRIFCAEPVSISAENAQEKQGRMT
jgi:hypothetical protein